MSKKNIIISLPIVWSIRNVFYSGLVDKLHTKYIVYYLVPKEGRQLLIDKLGIESNFIIVHTDLKYNHWISILNQALQLNFSRQSPPHNECFKTFHPKKKSVTSVLRKMIASMFAGVLSRKKINSIINSITKKQIGAGHFKTISTIRPEFIFSTAHVTEIEKYYFQLYAGLGYRTYAFIFSFDNLLSRGYVPLEHFDKILVWNKKMKEEVIEYYKIPEDKIYITGSPQFELNKQGLPARARLKFNLKDDELVILYCANHYSHTPTEPELVKQIIQQAAERKVLQNYKWVIRLHPLDNFKRWDCFRKTMPGVIINEPWAKTTGVYFWDIPSKEEFLLLGDLMAISSIVLNMASTTTLDAISINKPVIGIGFSTIDPTESAYYYDCHFSEHFKLITASGAFDLATGINELFVKMTENIKDPEKNRIQRDGLIHSLMVSDKDAVDLITGIISN
jgi:hypothetical protein